MKRTCCQTRCRLLELPPELRELVYAALPAADRARFNMALPSDARPAPLRGPQASKDRTLGVLAGAARKRVLTRMTQHMRDFLCTVPKTDPTWRDLLESGLPGLADVPYVPQRRSLEDRLDDGTATLADLPEIWALPAWKAVTALARLPPDTFDEFARHQGGQADVKDGRALVRLAAEAEHDAFAFALSNHRNGALLRHLVARCDAGGNNSAAADDATVHLLWARAARYLATPDVLIGAGHALRETVFECVAMPPDTVRALHLHALETLHVDAALFYAQHLP